MVGIISTAAIAFVAFKVGDLVLVYPALILIGAVMGFFIWNYPRGLVFLGDGGAYLIGFVISALSILLVHRNPTVSPWFVLLVNVYPVFETLFTIWRRYIHEGRSAGLPDGAHFHSLIYRRVLRWANAMDRPGANTEPHHYYLNNAKTSPYLWFISSIGVIPALLFWESAPLLIASTILFVAIYIYCYCTIVQRRKPWWLLGSPPPEIDKTH
jgi:UDP-GlcNAc:undecaprenyl-phosphate GlcNAc-1-phosphate transferase